MVPVFIGGPSKPCSKTMNCMVLAAVVALPGSVAPARLAGAPEGLWREFVRTMAFRRPMRP